MLVLSGGLLLEFVMDRHLLRRGLVIRAFHAAGQVAEFRNQLRSGAYSGGVCRRSCLVGSNRRSHQTRFSPG